MKYKFTYKTVGHIAIKSHRYPIFSVRVATEEYAVISLHEFSRPLRAALHVGDKAAVFGFQTALCVHLAHNFIHKHVSAERETFFNTLHCKAKIAKLFYVHIFRDNVYGDANITILPV